MPYTPDIAIRLLEKITANNKQMEELKQKISQQIRAANLTGAPFSDAEDTLSEMDKFSLQIQVDYERLMLETSEAPEVA